MRLKESMTASPAADMPSLRQKLYDVWELLVVTLLRVVLAAWAWCSCLAMLSLSFVALASYIPDPDPCHCVNVTVMVAMTQRDNPRL